MTATHMPTRKNQRPATVGAAVFLDHGGAMSNLFEINANASGGTIHFSTYWSSDVAYSEGEYWGAVQEYAQDGNRSLVRGTITSGDDVGGAFEFFVTDGKPDRVQGVTYPPDVVPAEWPSCAEQLALPYGTDLGELTEGDLRVLPPHERK